MLAVLKQSVDDGLKDMDQLVYAINLSLKTTAIIN